MASTEPDFFEANFSLLKKHYPELWGRFSANPPALFGDPFYSPTGLPNLRAKNAVGEMVVLHDERDPAAEIRQFLKIVPLDATGFVAFLGMGLGYTPLAFLAERPSLSRVVIFELDERIFWRALQLIDLAPLLKNPRVTLLVGRNPDIIGQLSPFKAALSLEAIYTLEHFRAFALDAAGYGALKNNFFQFANSLNIGGNTVANYGKAFVDNRFHHLSGISHDYFLDSLHNAFAGVPAILVAGGPSLNKNIHILPQAKGRAVVIAVDTVVPPLLKRKIRPDFVASIDMKPTTLEKYTGHADDLSGTSLIAAPWVTPKVPKILQVDRVFWLFSQNNMEQWLNRHLGGKMTFPGAATVAQLNFFAAVLLGCSPIILVGQDFAFSDDQDHAAEVFISFREQVQHMLADKKELHYVPGTLGGTVATQRSYLSMKQAMEAAISSNPNTYINATEGGAHIEGTEVMSLQDALDRFCLADNSTVSSRLAVNMARAKKPNLDILLQELRKIEATGQAQLKYLEQGDELGERILRELDKLENRSGVITGLKRLPSGLQASLRKHDELQRKIDSDGIWALLSDLTTSGLRQAERMKVLIEQLREQPAQYLLWLRKSVERVLMINQVRRQVLSDLLSKVVVVEQSRQTELELLARDCSSLATNMELARFYLAGGDIRLARGLLEKLLVDNRQCAEIHFLLGKVALMQANFVRATDFFAETAKLSPPLASAIASIRHDCAEEYLGFFNQRRTSNRSAAIKMLLKGMACDAAHEKIKSLLLEELERDLVKIAVASQDHAELLKLWFAGLENNPGLAPLLTPAQLAALFYARGQLFFNAEDYAEALVFYQRAAGESPNDPRIQVAIFEAFFNLGNYKQAVAALDRAVGLDRALAKHWEDLGDLLAGAGQPADALAAYEKCFVALPERIDLLKKIGDCHQALNQPEGAVEAYRQLTQRLESP